MTVMVPEDRSMCVQPHQIVRTAWVDINLCRLSFRLPLSPEAVEKTHQRLLNLEQCAPWPPIVGHWEDGSSSVMGGTNHLAALTIGRDKLFVCWLETAPEAIPDLRQPEADACVYRKRIAALPRSRPNWRSSCRIERSHGFRGATRLNLPGSSVRGQHVGEPRILREGDIGRSALPPRPAPRADHASGGPTRRSVSSGMRLGRMRRTSAAIAGRAALGPGALRKQPANGKTRRDSE